jgi:hypothetical protein
MARWAGEVTLAAYRPIVLTGGSRELNADEGAVGYVDRSYVSYDTALLAGGFHRLADFDGSHRVHLLSRHNAMFHELYNG